MTHCGPPLSRSRSARRPARSWPWLASRRFEPRVAGVDRARCQRDGRIGSRNRTDRFGIGENREAAIIRLCKTERGARLISHGCHEVDGNWRVVTNLYTAPARCSRSITNSASGLISGRCRHRRGETVCGVACGFLGIAMGLSGAVATSPPKAGERAERAVSLDAQGVANLARRFDEHGSDHFGLGRWRVHACDP